MRRSVPFLFALVLAVAMLLLVGGTAESGDPKRDEPYPVELQVGEIFKVCLSGEVVCPVRAPICDDLKIVDVVDTPDGLGFLGKSPGTTLCSVMGGTSMGGGLGFRRVFRITVR